MDFNIPHTRRKRVVIVGGGFGGLKLARKLAGAEWQVVLVDRNNYHQFPPLIYQVASAGLEPGSIAFPFRQIFRRRGDFHFRMAEVRAVRPEANRIETTIGGLEYDMLVLAAGTTTNFYGNERIGREALPMKTVQEALELRNTLLDNLEKALTSTSEEVRDELLNVVVAGGGATGVEIAGVLAEMKRFVLPRDYPGLPAERMRIRLVEAGDRLLAGMSHPSSDAAARFLARMGVEVLLGRKVVDYRGRRVVLEGGTELPARTFVWVSGVRAEQMGAPGVLPTGRGGRIEVDAYNRVQGLRNVYAIGDQCVQRADGRYPDGHPQLAQVAIQQGAHLAANLRREAVGQPMRPFRYRNLGVMATVGRNRAVAEFGHMRFSGWVAWVLWLVVHLRSILGVKNKLIVFINWVWNYFTYDLSLRLILYAEKPREEGDRANRP